MLLSFKNIRCIRSFFSLLVRPVWPLVLMFNVLIFPVAAAPLNNTIPAPDLRVRFLNKKSALAANQKITSKSLVSFETDAFSFESRKLVDWVIDSADNGKLPFIIIDKVNAQVLVFDAQGQLKGSSTALLGLAVGDDSVPGIGQRKLSSIRPEERTTPAGRFVASLDTDVHGQEILWVDYDLALSLHRVATGQPKEHRKERLDSLNPLDKRISFGCINVPVKFYEQIVSPSFVGTTGIVYILPETLSAHDVFGSYDVKELSRRKFSAD